MGMTIYNNRRNLPRSHDRFSPKSSGLSLKCPVTAGRRRGIPDGNGGRIVIHSGLSVTVADHEISVSRNMTEHCAVIVVTALSAREPSGAEQVEIEEAAALLAARASRFLGGDWTVVGWVPDWRGDG